jgi:radical SAM protein with 4Fe4S-binding SPASM domain
LKDTDQSYSFYITIPLCILDPVVKNELINNKRITTSCHVARGTATIFTEDGTVIPCNHFTKKGMGKYGEDFSGVESFRSFWRSEALELFRKRFNSYPHENCINCSDWNICGGGCKIKWMHYNPKDYIGKRRKHE